MEGKEVTRKEAMKRGKTPEGKNKWQIKEIKDKRKKLIWPEEWFKSRIKIFWFLLYFLIPGQYVSPYLLLPEPYKVCSRVTSVRLEVILIGHQYLRKEGGQTSCKGPGSKYFHTFTGHTLSYNNSTLTS